MVQKSHIHNNNLGISTCSEDNDALPACLFAWFLHVEHERGPLECPFIIKDRDRSDQSCFTWCLATSHEFSSAIHCSAVLLAKVTAIHAKTITYVDDDDDATDLPATQVWLVGVRGAAL